MELFQANKNWLSRPADERFTSLHDLRDSVTDARRHSAAKVISSKALSFRPVDGDSSYKGLEIVSKSTGAAIAPTHWSFGQIANRLGAPAGFMRELPAPMVADILNYKSAIDRDSEDLGILIGTDDNRNPVTLRAATSPKYGRVWNQAIADSMVNLFGDGVSGAFRVPGAFGELNPVVTKSNTTLYASDRDMFIFLADQENRIELPNRRNGRTGSLARGVFVWNSETGASSFGMAAFLFDFMCSNHIIWGAAEYRESRFRHTASAPDKWLDHVAPVIEAYSKSSARPYEAALIAAQSKRIDDVQAFMNDRFSKRMATAILASHVDEESRPVETLWDAATAITAYAKGIPFMDERVTVERVAGKVLDLAL